MITPPALPPKHAKPTHTVRWAIVTAVSLLVLAAIGWAAWRYPNLGIHKPSESLCRYAASNVVVVVDGPECTPVMRQVVADSDIPWGWIKKRTGKQVAQLTNGKSTIRIYDAGNPALAGALARHFADAKWQTEAPSP